MNVRMRFLCTELRKQNVSSVTSPLLSHTFVLVADSQVTSIGQNNSALQSSVLINKGKLTEVGHRGQETAMTYDCTNNVYWCILLSIVGSHSEKLEVSMCGCFVRFGREMVSPQSVGMLLWLWNLVDLS